MFELQFVTDNAAFDGENLRREIADKLTEIADYVRNNGINWRYAAIRDSNGNRIGSWDFTE